MPNHDGANSSDNSDKGNLRAKKTIKKQSMHNTDAHEEKKKRVKMDMIMITTALVLQDLPFFCLRMTLIFGQVLSAHLIALGWQTSP